MPAETPRRCAHCGGPIPPRPDPRGRPASYCTGACRAAASRVRAARAAQLAVQEAHAAADRPLAIEDVEKFAAGIVERIERRGAGAGGTDYTRLALAARRMVEAEDHAGGRRAEPVPPAPASTAGLTRQQRRAAERADKRRG